MFPETGTELATGQDEASCTCILAIPPDRFDRDTSDVPVSKESQAPAAYSWQEQLSYCVA